MNDADFRATLKHNLLEQHREQPGTTFLEELELRQGETRVDVAVVNGLLHGYEIKSARDTLSRLPQQALSYGLVLDKATLVVAERHLPAALEILPEWWGVEVVTPDEHGHLQIEALHPPQPNPGIDSFHVAELLWRDEALQFLDERGFARGYRAKSRAVLHRRIAAVADVDEIRACVRYHLKNRKGWKAVSSSMTSVD